MTVVGLVLAGGRSTRFGSEKAVAPWNGRRMMDGPVDALRCVCDAVVVSARPGSGAADHARSLGLSVVADGPGPCGPLNGVAAGLAWATARQADWLVTIPCDVPEIDPANLSRLIAAAQAHRAPAVARSAHGLEPLIAVWPVRSSVTRLADLLSQGRHPGVGALLLDWGACPVQVDPGPNVNHRPDASG